MDEAFEAEKARQARIQDVADFNNEMAGVSTGRALRFTTKEEFQRRAAKAKGENPDSDRVAERMLVQLAYEQTYQRVIRELDIEDRAADMALKDIHRELRDNALERQRLLDNAYQLPDGRHIFMTRDESAAYDEYDRRLSDAEFAGLPKDELRRHTRRDVWLQNKERRHALQNEERQVLEFKAEGRDVKARGKNLSKDELEQVEKARNVQMPARVRAYLDDAAAENLQLGPDGQNMAESTTVPWGRSVSLAADIAGHSVFTNAPDAAGSFRAASMNTQVDDAQPPPATVRRPPGPDLSH